VSADPAVLGKFEQLGFAQAARGAVSMFSIAAACSLNRATFSRAVSLRFSRYSHSSSTSSPRNSSLLKLWWSTRSRRCVIAFAMP